MRVLICADSKIVRVRYKLSEMIDNYSVFYLNRNHGSVAHQGLLSQAQTHTAHRHQTDMASQKHPR